MSFASESIASASETPLRLGASSFLRFNPLELKVSLAKQMMPC